MKVTATELKRNLGKYLDLLENEDIIITKNGKPIAQLTKPELAKKTTLNSLVGIVKSEEDIDLDEIKKERLKRQ